MRHDEDYDEWKQDKKDDAKRYRCASRCQGLVLERLLQPACAPYLFLCVAVC